jgi:hypothetical protein
MAFFLPRIPHTSVQAQPSVDLRSHHNVLLSALARSRRKKGNATSPSRSPSPPAREALATARCASFPASLNASNRHESPWRSCRGSRQLLAVPAGSLDPKGVSAAKRLARRAVAHTAFADSGFPPARPHTSWEQEAGQERASGRASGYRTHDALSRPVGRV